LIVLNTKGVPTAIKALAKPLADVDERLSELRNRLLDLMGDTDLRRETSEFL
jgi:hypothetical protein